MLDPDVSNSLVVTYTPIITTDESGELKFEKDDEMGNFVITSGEPFVIRSDMYFQGNLTISLKSISKELSDSGQAGLYLPMVTLYSKDMTQLLKIIYI